MTRNLKQATARFCKDESGAASVIEFAIVLPLFAVFLGAMVEMGWMNIRHAMLERGLDTMLVVAAAHKSHAERRVIRIDRSIGYGPDALI